MHARVGSAAFVIFKSPFGTVDQNGNHALMSSLETEQASWEAARRSLRVSVAAVHIQGNACNDATWLNTLRRVHTKATIKRVYSKNGDNVEVLGNSHEMHRNQRLTNGEMNRFARFRVFL